MRLIASLIVRNERSRYLELCIAHLLEFCDEIRIVDDGSNDGTEDLVSEAGSRIRWLRNTENMFYRHEGRARQQLLAWTLEANPTHVLAIDGDELVDDGQALRAFLSEYDGHTGLCMEEVWEAREDGYSIRTDGGWRAYGGTFVWRVDQVGISQRRIADRQLACGRIPVGVKRQARQSGVSLLHFGWANRAERQARYDRYVTHDGGEYHASSHLESIMWGDDRVKLMECGRPDGLRDVWSALVGRSNLGSL